MADYLLDTNILSYWYDIHCVQYGKVAAKVNLARMPDPKTQYVSRFFVSFFTLGEMEYGHRVQTVRNDAKQVDYAKFINEQCPIVLEIDRRVTEDYGELRAWLFNNCGPKKKGSKVKRAEELVNPATGKELGIDENDIWIAAQARMNNLVLVTNDSRGNFGKVLAHFASTLKVENWTL